MDRLVEDLIQEAMNKGEFSDLPGTGKPLKDNSCNQNPYVDFVTHKLNQVSHLREYEVELLIILIKLCTFIGFD